MKELHFSAWLYERSNYEIFRYALHCSLWFGKMTSILQHLRHQDSFKAASENDLRHFFRHVFFSFFFLPKPKEPIKNDEKNVSARYSFFWKKWKITKKKKKWLFERNPVKFETQMIQIIKRKAKLIQIFFGTFERKGREREEMIV